MEQQQHIDQLLERYLTLLDEYTDLRQSLSQLQSGVFQNIARANFSGERGMRYGQDHYDERMQASRLLVINVDEKAQRAKVGVIRAPEPKSEPEQEQEEESGQGKHGKTSSEQDSKTETRDEAAAKQDATRKGKDQGEEEEEEQGGDKKKKNEPKKRKASRNPLHWYGLFAPMPLRTAQTQSIQAVEGVIPRLICVNNEMLDVEIEIRRARKRRAKAETTGGGEKTNAESDAQSYYFGQL